MRESPQSMSRQRQAAASQDRGGRTMKRPTMKRAVWLLAATLVACMASQVAPAAAQDGKWRMAKPMLAPQGVVVGGKIYVIGGAHANIPGKPMTEPLWAGVPQIVVGTVEEYDPATNTWRARAPMPTGRNHFYAGVVDGKIYAVNGRLGAPFVTMSDLSLIHISE